MWKFQLEQLDSLDDNFLESFNRLEPSDHLDGKYRLRAYSVFKHVKGFHTDAFVKLPERAFTQSSEYNKHQGDLERKFDSVSNRAAYSGTLQDLLVLFSKQFDLDDGQEIEVHQMRVITQEGGKLSPEGVHQDGFDRIMMMGVSRHNITGGHLLLYKTKDGDPVVNFPLEDGEIAYLDDTLLWHNGSPLKRIDPSTEGHMDLLICLTKFKLE